MNSNNSDPKSNNFVRHNVAERPKPKMTRHNLRNRPTGPAAWQQPFDPAPGLSTDGLSPLRSDAPELTLPESLPYEFAVTECVVRK
jgi:hypothetical protein